MNTRGLGSQLKDSISVPDFSASGTFESHDVIHRGQRKSLKLLSESYGCYANPAASIDFAFWKLAKNVVNGNHMTLGHYNHHKYMPVAKHPYFTHVTMEMLRWFFPHVKSELFPVHPLELSEKNFSLTQDKMNFSTLRNIQGLHAPLKLQMEFKAVKQIQRLPFLHSSNLALDILKGNDDCIGFEDIFGDPAQSELMAEPHMMVEHKLGLL